MEEYGGGKGVPGCGVCVEEGEGPDQICVETVVGATSEECWASRSMPCLIDRFVAMAGRFAVGC